MIASTARGPRPRLRSWLVRAPWLIAPLLAACATDVHRVLPIDAGFAADGGGVVDGGGAIDGGLDDGGSADGGAIDGAASDDGGTNDAGTADAGLVDGGANDGGPIDGGLGDGGLDDAGLGDGGVDDGGVLDGGANDGGPIDAGPPPAPPTLTGTTPRSPANAQNPLIKGVAAPGVALQIFTQSACAGSVAAQGMADDLGQFSIATRVAANATTTLSARARNAGGPSGCSNDLTYVHDATLVTGPFLRGTSPASPTSVTTMPLVFGGALAGYVVRLYARADCTGAVLGSDTATVTNAFSIPITVAANATTIIYGTATEPGGRVSPCSEGLPFTHDTIAPAPPSITGSEPASPGQSLRPTLRGRAEAGTTVAIFAGAGCTGDAAATVVASAAGDFSAAVDAAPNRESTFSANATDGAGNGSACGAVFGYRHDDTPPSPPTLTATRPASPTRATTSPAVDGRAEAGSTVRLYLQAGCAGMPGETATADGTGAFTTTVTVPSNAATSLSATATDAAGNTSACSEPLVFVHDTTPPAAPVLTGTTPPSPSREQSPALVGTAEAGASIAIFGQAACAGAAIATGTTTSMGTFSIAAPATRNATTTFSARATDAAGNASPCSAGLDYAEDDRPPRVPTLASTTPPSPSNTSTTPTLLGSTEADASVRVFVNAPCTGTPAATVSAFASGGFQATVTVPANAASNLYADATDALGNTSACSAPLLYTHDTQPPAAPVWVGTTPASPSNTSTTPTLRGTAEVSATLRIFADTGCQGSALATRTADPATGAFSMAVMVAANATTRFSATATDPAGNVSPCSADLVYTHDDRAPAAPELVGTEPASPSGATTTPTLRGRAEAGATVNVFVAGCTGPVLATTTSDPSGAFAVPTPVTRNAATTLTARAIDAAGNGSPCSAPLTFVHDDVAPSPPTVASTTPPSPSPVATGIVVAGAAEARSTVRLYGTRDCSNAPLATVTASDGSAWQATIDVPHDAATSLAARATDAAGNVSLCGSPLVYVHDDVAPNAPTLTGTAPTSPSRSELRPVVSGTAEPQSRVDVYVNDTCTEPSAATTLADATGAFSVAVPVAANATTRFSARATDAAGNASSCASASFTYVHDSIAPDAPSFTGTTPPSPSSTVTSPLVNGTAEAGATVRLHTDSSCAAAPIVTGPADGTGHFALTVSVTNATLTLRASAVDAAGNVSGCSSTSATYTHDSIAPSFGGATSATAVSESELRVAWGAGSDNLTAQSALVYEVCVSTLRRADGGCSPFVTALQSTPGAASVVVGALASDTRYYLAVRARDLAGNRDANTAEVNAKTFFGRPTVAVVGGGAHTCARLGDGTLRCFGQGASGQLGNGTTTLSTSPVSVTGLSAAVSLATLADATCAVLADGTARCFGQNAVGQLGNGGSSDSATPVAVTGLTNAVEIVGGAGHACARRTDGTARCWGKNDAGQLGDGTTTGRGTAAAVSSLVDAVALAAGASHTCAVRATGEARCWGANAAGQLGDGTTTARSVAGIVSGLPTTISLAAGDAHTCALASDGTVRCWGDNGTGQLGDGTTTARATAAPVPGLASIVSLAASGRSTCAVSASGDLYCWGDDASGQLGDGATSPRTTPTLVSLGARARAAGLGSAHACFVLADGSLRCTGANASGQLGDGTRTTRGTASDVLGLRGVQAGTGLGAGGSETCARLVDGTMRCFGDDAYGQLGDGTTVAKSVATPVAGLGSVLALGVGASHACAIVGDGTARCWGNGQNGRLGNGATASASTPTTVTGLAGATAISPGGGQTCALLGDGTARCWGTNTSGELGDNTRTQRTTPVSVVGLAGARRIASGTAHVCALGADGIVRCWGNGILGQLGDGTSSTRGTPTVVATVSGATRIASGANHACALVASGGARCWGLGGSGQLGDSGFLSRPTPVTVVGLVDAVELAAGSGHTCALVAGGAVRCWGDNGSGQLGDGTSTPRATPIAVSGVTGAVALSAGATHTCALFGDGSARCWGSNTAGELGDGTLLARPTAAPVISFP